MDLENNNNNISNQQQEIVQNEQQIEVQFEKQKYVKTKIEALCYLIWRDATKRFYLRVEVIEIDPDFYMIHIGDIITLKIVQIRQFIRIFCGKTPFNQNIDLLFSIGTFFDEKRSNKISLEDDKIVCAFANKLIYNRVLTIFNSRIYFALNQEQITNQLIYSHKQFIVCINTNPVLLRICRFLNKKDLLKFLTLDSHSSQKYAQNKEFWFHLHSSKFGKTGFKLNQLDWKKVYLGKIK